MSGGPRRPAADGPQSRSADARSSIDDIIELYKRDVDRTLLREQLRKTPAERMEDLQSMARFLVELRAGMKRPTR